MILIIFVIIVLITTLLIVIDCEKTEFNDLSEQEKEIIKKLLIKKVKNEQKRKKSK